jgi:hypothetical protein
LGCDQNPACYLSVSLEIKDLAAGPVAIELQHSFPLGMAKGSQMGNRYSVPLNMAKDSQYETGIVAPLHLDGAEHIRTCTY